MWLRNTGLRLDWIRHVLCDHTNVLFASSCKRELECRLLPFCVQFFVVFISKFFCFVRPKTLKSIPILITAQQGRTVNNARVRWGGSVDNDNGKDKAILLSGVRPIALSHKSDLTQIVFLPCIKRGTKFRPFPLSEIRIYSAVFKRPFYVRMMPLGIKLPTWS